MPRPELPPMRRVYLVTERTPVHVLESLHERYGVEMGDGLVVDTMREGPAASWMREIDAATLAEILPVADAHLTLGKNDGPPALRVVHGGANDAS